jgi:hypothetical protein
MHVYMSLMEFQIELSIGTTPESPSKEILNQK